MVKSFNKENFMSEVLEAKGTVLVDFYADWCGPCRMVAPIVEEISNEREDVIVGKINVDESPEIAVKYNVMSIPTLIVFKDGKEYERIIGYKPKDSILEIL